MGCSDPIHLALVAGRLKFLPTHSSFTSNNQSHLCRDKGPFPRVGVYSHTTGTDGRAHCPPFTHLQQELTYWKQDTYYIVTTLHDNSLRLLISSPKLLMNPNYSRRKNTIRDCPLQSHSTSPIYFLFKENLHPVILRLAQSPLLHFGNILYAICSIMLLSIAVLMVIFLLFMLILVHTVLLLVLLTIGHPVC